MKVERVQNGETLGRLANQANAVLLHADDELSQEAKQVAATLFDYIRDLLDVGDDASCSDKLNYNKDLELNYNKDLETMLRELVF